MEHGVHALAALLSQREDGVAEESLAGDDDDLKVERDIFRTIEIVLKDKKSLFLLYIL